ncbi:hypothetical protein BGZ76_001514 [Entomortierella beljakovae]|nr:hypothetical protein BGZ76_001514 [Entomortierella beljakovae]
MTVTPKVNIPGCGVVQGVQVEEQPSVAKFLNIPYATVQERWRSAVKATPWSGVRDASVQGPVCQQPKSSNPMVSITGEDIDEDDEEAYSKAFSEEHCLNLNIFAPHDQLNSKSQLIPVMVWIHGGGYKDGSNGMSLYDGSNMVAHSVKNLGRPVIVVVINYRLNYFGFLSSTEIVQDIQSDKRLSSKNHENSFGNWGLLDQRIALEWVRDHIEAFGGNPKDVTAFGESAGAASIGYHMSIPDHHGLFQRAILQSGTAVTMAAGPAETAGQRRFNQLCRHFGLDKPEISAAEKIARLRKISAKELVKAGDGGKVGMFTPTIDNILIKGDSREWSHDPSRYDPGLKSVMLGDCRDEGTMFIPELGARSLKHWSRFKARHCPPGEEKEFDVLYGEPKTDSEAVEISGKVISDVTFLYPIHAVTLALLRSRELIQGRETLEIARYHFDRPLKIVEDMGMGLGAHHAAEIPFVFGSDTYLDIFTDEEKELSRRMMEIWILFAWGESRQYDLKHGLSSALPSDAGVKFKEALVFTEECTVEKALVERLDGGKLAFWKRSEEWIKKRIAERTQKARL